MRIKRSYAWLIGAGVFLLFFLWRQRAQAQTPEVSAGSDAADRSANPDAAAGGIPLTGSLAAFLGYTKPTVADLAPLKVPTATDASATGSSTGTGGSRSAAGQTIRDSRGITAPPKIQIDSFTLGHPEYGQLMASAYSTTDGQLAFMEALGNGVDLADALAIGAAASGQASAATAGLRRLMSQQIR